MIVIEFVKLMIQPKHFYEFLNQFQISMLNYHFQTFHILHVEKMIAIQNIFLLFDNYLKLRLVVEIHCNTLQLIRILSLFESENLYCMLVQNMNQQMVIHMDQVDICEIYDTFYHTFYVITAMLQENQYLIQLTLQFYLLQQR